MSIIKYADLIKYQQYQVKALRYNREVSRSQGVTQFYGINKNIEIAERILTILKKWNKDPEQENLFDLNVIENHKA